MNEGLQILEAIFPDRKIPSGLKELISPLPFSRTDLGQASPDRLVEPFSIPGLEEMLSRLTEDLSAGNLLTIRTGNAPDVIPAISLLKRIFKEHRKRIRLERTAGRGEGPTLEFDAQTGLLYQTADHRLNLSPVSPSGGRYSTSGLIFKLGQGRQRMAEPSFGRHYLAFDLETTGTDPLRDEIIEIGAVRISDGALGEEFSALVKPSRTLPRLISELTGITDQDLAEAPPLTEVLPKFLDFMGDSVLVAHNIDFDYAFLKRAAHRILKKKLSSETFCTLVAARRRMPGQSHRLGAVAEALGIELKDWHRATADARAAAEIFIHFQEEDNAPKRYEYFRQALGRACLGTLLAQVPISDDNAIFFRHGFEDLIREYQVGEKYFQRRPIPEVTGDLRLLSDLDSWWRRKRGRAVYRLVKNATG